MMRGDVVVAHFAGTSGRRPGIIVTRDVVIPLLPSLMLVPITRSRRGIDTEVELATAEGLAAPCVASCDNVTSVAKSDIVARIGSLGPERRRELDHALRLALDLDE